MRPSYDEVSSVKAPLKQKMVLFSEMFLYHTYVEERILFLVVMSVLEPMPLL